MSECCRETCELLEICILNITSCTGSINELVLKKLAIPITEFGQPILPSAIFRCRMMSWKSSSRGEGRPRWQVGGYLGT